MRRDGVTASLYVLGGKAGEAWKTSLNPKQHLEESSVQLDLRLGVLELGCFHRHPVLFHVVVSFILLIRKLKLIQ